jgi:hypothetical protein
LRLVELLAKGSFLSLYSLLRAAPPEQLQIPKPESDNRVAFHLGIREDGCYSTSALAQKLGVGIHTIHYWREKGIVPAIRDTPHGPWWHPVTPEVLQSLRQKIRRVPLNEE